MIRQNEPNALNYMFFMALRRKIASFLMNMNGSALLPTPVCEKTEIGKWKSKLTVAEIFRIVVRVAQRVVDQHRGLSCKFESLAALEACH